MKISARTIRRLVIGAILLLLAAVLGAPFLSGQRFAPRIQHTLEATLHRRVEFRDVRFNLLRGPGFSLRDVVIHDAPAFGREPIAYVDSVEAQVSLTSLLAGRLRFSNLRLVEPSVNLVRNSQGAWNFQPLLSRAIQGTGRSEPALPKIQVRSGRVNFRFQDLKSIFYIADADIDLAPYPAPEGGFGMRFEGNPARTDRAAQPFGVLRGRLRWRPAAAGEGRADMEVALEKSPIGELMMLAQGRDIGLHGLLSGQARITGPPSNLDISGSLRIEDIHRWDLMPSKEAAWLLQYRGRLSLTAERLELDSLPQDNPGIPISLRLRVSDFLAQPRWGILAEFDRVPLGGMLEVARHLGAPLPAQLALDGSATGAVGYSPPSGFQGMLGLADASVRLTASPLRLEKARLLIDGGKLQLAPSLIRFERGAVVQAGAAFDKNTQAFEVSIGLHALPVAELRQSALPLLSRCDGGTVNGVLQYRQAGETAGEWTGDVNLVGTRIPLEFLAEPLAVDRAHLRLEGARVRVRGLSSRAGGVAVTGEYQYQPGARRPHRFHLVVPRLEAAGLERLLTPALRRRRGFLARTLRFVRPPLPEWLSSLHADGTAEIGEFVVGDWSAGSLRARLFWDGASVKLTSLRGRVGGGAADGWLTVDLGDAAPAYRLGGRIEQMAWKEGTISLDGLLETYGSGAALLAEARVDCDFRGENLHLLADQEFEALSGHVDISPAAEWRFSAVRVRMGEEQLYGQGTGAPDGRLRFELTGGKETLPLEGAAFPFSLGRAKEIR